MAQLGTEPSTKSIQLPNNEEPTKLSQITVRMPASFLITVKNRASSKGMATSRWITALVQSNLLSQPVMSDLEVQALNRNSRELAAIGRNINQIARALNEAFFETERIRLDKLAELTASIAENKTVIRALVRSSQQGWGV